MTVALHYVFDSPKDKMVFDVSHQCYPYKILTGRKEAFLDSEHFGDATDCSDLHCNGRYCRLSSTVWRI